MDDTRLLTFREAALKALFIEMYASQDVIVTGEDVGAAGGVFKQTEGLFAEFGAHRVIDTPISESGAFGMAIGAAMSGMRPVFEVMFGDFMTLCMDQLVNQAAKVRYMSPCCFSKTACSTTRAAPSRLICPSCRWDRRGSCVLAVMSPLSRSAAW